MKHKINSASTNDGIPISVSIGPTLEREEMTKSEGVNVVRLLYICSLAVVNALLVGFIAKVMIFLIDFVTGIAFYGSVSPANTSPAGNHLGLWVICIPVIGGIIVAFMARYGSRAIQGHGIPETMEQVLTNHSRVKPIVTLLKPLSAAVSIGTGGPFGAEGPIIAAGGAFGSLIGQLLRITSFERKVLLTSGAAAGMAAIFGSPVAAIMLAVELLLFEFSARSIIPVALAAITGGCCHIAFFGLQPMFPMPDVQAPTPLPLVAYLVIGSAVGLASVIATKAIYIIEDLFEKLPIHWMWWPAIGGLVVGVVGYFAPATMGVGYNNITSILGGRLTISALLIFAFLKFISWSVALGSGTSGGTLAPLFTIGGALGALFAIAANHLFPSLGLSPSIGGLIGMAAMFSGAARAILTSIIFSTETTHQSQLLLPLLGGCASAYCMSFILMKNTIMTERIERRGIRAPDEYIPDILQTIHVKEALNRNPGVLDASDTIGHARQYIKMKSGNGMNETFIVTDSNNGEESFAGIITKQQIYNPEFAGGEKLGTVAVKPTVAVYETDLLKKAVDIILRDNLDAIPVFASAGNNRLAGVLTHRDILERYRIKQQDSVERNKTISLRKEGMRFNVRAKRWMQNGKS